MALTITNATIGYDRSGVEALKQAIRLKVVDQAIDRLETSFDSLTSSIDNMWVGHSAEIFKSNMHSDVDKIKTALSQTCTTLEAELDHIMGAMGQVDEDLVKDRG